MVILYIVDEEGCMMLLCGYVCCIFVVEFFFGVVIGYGMKFILLGIVVWGIIFLGEKGD